MTYRPLSRRYKPKGMPDCMRPATPPDVMARILAMGRAGELHKCIAADCGVHIAHVSHVLTRAGLGRQKRTRAVVTA